MDLITLTGVGVLLLGEEPEGGDLCERAASDEDDEGDSGPVLVVALVPPPKVGRRGLLGL